MRTIRATLQNVDDAAQLFNQYRSFYKQKSDLEGAQQFLSERIQNGESMIYLVMDDEAGRAAGFMQLYPTFSSISMKRALILNDLYVHESYRQRGVAKMLLDAAKDLAVEYGTNGLELATAVTNETAQRLYETYGFERDTHFYHYYLNVRE